MKGKAGSFIVVSGGQTGADRAALNITQKHGMTVEGWCPRGRWAEDGPLAAHYPLRETDSDDPKVRTEANVRLADATLVLTLGGIDDGTALTIELADAVDRPCLVVDLRQADALENAVRWLADVCPPRLNIAGLRESNAPGLQQAAQRFLDDLFRHVGVDDDLDQAVRR